MTAIAPRVASARVFCPDFARWRRCVSESFVPLDVEPVRSGSFRATLHSASFGDSTICRIEADGHEVQRRARHLGDDPGCYKVSLLLAGTGLLVQDGREAVLHPGDLAVYDTARPYSLVFEERFRSAVLMFPRERLELPPDVMAEITARRIAGDAGVMPLVAPFLRSLAEGIGTLGGGEGRRLLGTAVDLVATALHAERGAASVSAQRRHRERLLGEIHDYVDENLWDRELCPAQIAAAHFISVRHLHGIFTEGGQTVSAHIRARRLERCARDLLDGALAHLSISTIAQRWGFAEPAYFSRVFRAEFGEAPSAYRRRTLAA